MCNLYRIKSANEEIARLFGIENAAGNAADEVYPGYSGLVVAEGRLRSMVWGFPLAQMSKRTGEPLKPRPVNNARIDKLDSFMWRYSFQERRCLIPLTAWAEAEGPRGAMTRTWLSLPDQPMFAVAGICLSSDEWGECYSMIMTDAVGEAAEVHDRMPVVLRPDEYSRWQTASVDEARALCMPFSGEVAIERTNVTWRQN
ncbi:MAG: SOS response-associated peptidase family protein [Alphaproteobacteria bacterium]|nr:SOS response-associated peptidase family protein [Gammaproteobacteria bacterium]MBU2342329.1 SOS response-associated peptidase family protein [Alphaproteobacteria bacterium]